MELAWEACEALLSHTRWLNGAWLVGVPVITCVLIGAFLAVALVAMTSRGDRVDAISAVAEVLAALLPWRAFRRHPGPAGRPPRNRPTRHGRSSRRPR